MKRVTLTALILSLLSGCSVFMENFKNEDSGIDADFDADIDSDNENDSDMTEDGDVDRDTESDTDTEADNNWPCPQVNPTNALLRITSLEISAPSALALPELQNILNEDMDTFDLLWIMEINFTDSLLTLGNGMTDFAPPTTEEELCTVRWNADYLGPDNIPIIINNDTFSVTTPIDSATLLFYYYGSPLLEVTFRHIELTNIALNLSHTLVGTPNPSPGRMEYSTGWEENGQFAGYLDWHTTQSITVSEGMTLCQLLCLNDCTTIEPEECVNQPVEIPNSEGMLGYRLVATVGAGAVSVID